jgi:hypothetical protein
MGMRLRGGVVAGFASFHPLIRRSMVIGYRHLARLRELDASSSFFLLASPDFLRIGEAS